MFQWFTYHSSSAILAIMAISRKAKIKKAVWNKGKAVGQMAPFTFDQVQIIRSLLQTEKKIRDLALFNVSVDTMLRASDLLPLKVADVTDHHDMVLSEFNTRQQKTKTGHLVALSPETQESLENWILHSGKISTDYLWTSIGNRKTRPYLTREQYANIVKKWASLVKLDPKRHSTHSMRRSKSALIYKKSRDLAACQKLLGHKSVGSTSAYLGVEHREALDLAKETKL